MPQVILCVGIEPSRLKFIDALGTDNYLIVVCKTAAKEAGMTVDYFKNAFTYIEADPDRFDSVSLDVYKLLLLCNPSREKADLLIVHDENYGDDTVQYRELADIILYLF